MKRYKCKTCGNTCLVDGKPTNDICGGCNNPNWKLLKRQEKYKVNGKNYIDINGEI